jgi:hypothetical protein
LPKYSSTAAAIDNGTLYFSMGMQDLTNQVGLPQLKITAFYGKSFARLVLRKSPNGVLKNLAAESADNSPEDARAKSAQTVRAHGRLYLFLEPPPALPTFSILSAYTRRPKAGYAPSRSHPL